MCRHFTFSLLFSYLHRWNFKVCRMMNDDTIPGARRSFLVRNIPNFQLFFEIANGKPCLLEAQRPSGNINDSININLDPGVFVMCILLLLYILLIVAQDAPITYEFVV